MNIDFSLEILRNIKEFQERMKTLIQKPNFSYKMARDFITSGEKNANISDDIYTEITSLQELRKNTISIAMRKAIAKAKLKGKEIPERFLDGNDLTPFFDEEIYNEYSSFGVYELMPWYSELEIEQLKEILRQNNSTENHGLDDDDER